MRKMLGFHIGMHENGKTIRPLHEGPGQHTSRSSGNEYETHVHQGDLNQQYPEIERCAVSNGQNDARCFLTHQLLTIQVPNLLD
jgi:hypothetical protein